MIEVKQNSTPKVPVKLVDATDRVTEETGITSPTVYYSANGGVSTQLLTPTFTEVDATNMPGAYLLTLTTGMTGTAGPLLIGLTKAGCAPVLILLDVVANVEADTYGRLGTPAGASIAADLVTLDNFIDTEVAAILAIAQKLDTALELDGAVYRLTLNALELAPTAPTVGQIRAEMDTNSTKLANLDAAVSTRLAASSYTAPDNTNIGLAKTAAEAVNARLPTDPADQSAVEAAISTRLATAGYTAPDNANIAAIKAKTDLIPAAPANEVTLALVEDILRNKQIVTDNGDGTKTVRVYDDAGTSVILTWVWTEATGTRARGV